MFERFYLNREGQFIINFVSPLYEYAVHWLDIPGFEPQKVKCAGSNCVLCDNRLGVSVRYLATILNRGMKRVTIFEFGSRIQEQISLYANHQKWGDPIKFEFIFDKKSRRGPPGVIFISPNSTSSFSNSEQKLIDKFRRQNCLDKMTEPNTNEEIIKCIGKEFFDTIQRTKQDRRPINQFQSKDNLGEDSQVAVPMGPHNTTQQQWDKFVEEVRRSENMILWYDYDYDNPICYRRIPAFGKVKWTSPCILYRLVNDVGRWFVPTGYKEKDGLIREDFNFEEDRVAIRSFK